MSSFSRSAEELRARARAAAATVRAGLPVVRDQAWDFAAALGRKANMHAPRIMSDLLEGKLPEVEAVMIATAQRISPVIGTAAAVVAGAVRRRNMGR